MHPRYSDRRTVYSHASRPASPRKSGKRRLLILVIFAVLIGVGVWHFMGASAARTPVAVAKASAKKVVAVTQPIATSTAKSAAKAPAATSTPCDSNQLDKAIIISISKRHLWACETGNSAYDSAVVTGMENIAADLTPTGTYHIYGKQTNLYLNGSDSTGSWHDYVYYWMPFLNNQYGTYGFHDATWRAPTDFGNIDPYSDKGSHGCVELPLATAKWLFNWAAVGTTVIIQS
ncbi:MAG: L,D-transpeptidase family protein [Candidatus Saccharibacteria bacterium]